MIWLDADVSFFTDALSKGPITNPTRSFILGDPTNGRIGVGCIIDLLGQTDIRGGSAGRARIGLVESEAAVHMATPVAIWYGRAIGTVHTWRSQDGAAI